MKENPKDARNELVLARDEFISQWGAMGTAWGINRTMAQIHALLMVTPNPLTTDEIMADLKISRGNAHGNLRELVSWGLIRSVVRKGERKEYFEAEKDVWKMFCIVMRERRRRELRPAMMLIQDCTARTKGLKEPEAVAFTKQIKALGDFLDLTDGVITKVTRSEQSRIIPWMMKFLK
jgi:DNA-binding transcriptional regulator GbsR (MarR family)